MNCPQCGAENADGAKFCSKCGCGLSAPVPDPIPTPVAPPPLTECPSCQTPRKESAKFCGNCGYQYEDASIPVASAAAPVSDFPEAPKAAPAQAMAAGDQPKSNNTVIIVIIIALVALIGAAATGWYLWNKKQSGAPDTSVSQSSAPAQPGQPQVDANGMPIMQPGQATPSTQATQPGQPQVDANGMPLPQAGQAAQPGIDGQQSAQPAQPGMNDRPPAQPAVAPQQDVMPDHMPREARKRRAHSEADVAPRRNVYVGGTIDEQFNRRAAAECPVGGSGFFCREKLRYRLCKHHWSANPPPGQTICQRAN